MALSLSRAECFESTEESSRWWIDNGAAQHVTHCSDYFISFERFDVSHCVETAGGELLQAVGKGVIPIRLNGGVVIQLQDVWYVPKISKNLFSVLAAHDRNRNSKFISESEVCRFEVKDRVILRGYRKTHGSLYEADFEPVRKEGSRQVNLSEKNDYLLRLYHERWGHQDRRHIRDPLKRELGGHDEEPYKPYDLGKKRSQFRTRKRSTTPDNHGRFKHRGSMKRESEMPGTFRKNTGRERQRERSRESSI